MIDWLIIINLHQYKEYGSRRLLTEIAEIKWNKWALTVYWKRFRKQKAPQEGTGEADRSSRILKRTWPLITVDKLVGLLSQEDQPQTHCSTRQLSRETGLTQSSVVRIICCDLGLNFLKCPKSHCAHELTAVSFIYINVSQGSVATQVRWGEIIHNFFIASFPQSVPVKEFLKSVNIWRRYGRKYGDMFFWLTV